MGEDPLSRAAVRNPWRSLDGESGAGAAREEDLKLLEEALPVAPEVRAGRKHES